MLYPYLISLGEVVMMLHDDDDDHINNAVPILDQPGRGGDDAS